MENITIMVDNSKIERKKRSDKLIKVMTFYNLDNNDLVHPLGEKNTGLATSPNTVSGWRSGTYAGITDKTITAISKRIAELQIERPGMHQEKFRSEYLRNVNDECMTEEQYQVHQGKRIEHAREFTHQERRNQLNNMLNDYILQYIWLEGFKNFTVQGIDGKEVLPPTPTMHKEEVWMFGGDCKAVFRSDDLEEYSISLKEWASMQQDIHDYIRFQVCKHIFQDDFKHLSLDEIEKKIVGI